MQHETLKDFEARVAKVKESLHDFDFGREDDRSEHNEEGACVLTWKVPTPKHVLDNFLPDPCAKRYEDFEWSRVPNATATLEFDDPKDHSIGASKFCITYAEGAKRATFDNENRGASNASAPLVFYIGSDADHGVVVEVSELDEITSEAHLASTYHGPCSYRNVALYVAAGPGTAPFTSCESTLYLSYTFYFSSFRFRLVLSNNR